MHKLKLLLTRIYLTFIATTPMIKLTQDECKVLLDAYAAHGMNRVHICYALATYRDRDLTDLLLPTPEQCAAYNIEKKIMNMLHSGWRHRDFSITAEDMGMGNIPYRVQWINQVMAYNDYPNKLHIIENGVLPKILSK